MKYSHVYTSTYIYVYSVSGFWEARLGSSHDSSYTFHQKKVTFSSLIFPGDPRLGPVSLGHFQNWGCSWGESSRPSSQGQWPRCTRANAEIECNFLSVKSVSVRAALSVAPLTYMAETWWTSVYHGCPPQKIGKFLKFMSPWFWPISR